MLDLFTEPLSNGTTLMALAQIAVLGTVSGAVGCWVVLYELSYSAESLAHGMFPGLVIAALIGAPLLLGGAIGVLVAAALVAVATRLSGDSAETAIAVVITALFGTGVLLALSPSSPPGIQGLLFGDLLGATATDIAIAATVGSAILGALWLLHHRLLAIGFDPGSAGSVGISAAVVNLALLALVAVTVLVAVQGLGNLLVAAILVGPAAAARQLTHRIGPMIAVSIGTAVSAGVIGIYASYHLKTAAGASVVVAILGLYILSSLAAAARSHSGRLTPGVRSVRATPTSPTGAP
jgi:ABC-type Mn2+/Zn2+ transport system permease subunit